MNKTLSQVALTARWTLVKELLGREGIEARLRTLATNVLECAFCTAQDPEPLLLKLYQKWPGTSAAHLEETDPNSYYLTLNFSEEA